MRAIVAAALIVVAVPAHGSGPSALRAVGWFKGKAEITQGRINCEIPNVSNAISEGSFVVGLWNTYGTQTIEYPDPTNPFGNPCGVWIQVQNNLFDQGISVDHFELRYRVQNARAFVSTVITARSFPYACRILRRGTVWVGNFVPPSNATGEVSSSGAPNVAFIEMLPFVSPQLLSCLRAVYAPKMTSVNSGLSLVARAVAVGRSDSGKTYRSNAIGYTLTLRHSCGNGRVDDGEQCDPTAPSTCTGICEGGKCSQDENRGCTSDTDCVGTCMAADVPSECTCDYGG